MSEYIDELRQIKIKVVSPSRATSARIDGQDGLRVSLNPDRLGEHDDASLAEEVETAVQECRNRYTRETRSLRQERREARLSERQPSEPSDSAIERRDDYAGRLMDLEVRATSSRGYVEVCAYGDGDLVVSIAPGTLRRIDVNAELLVREINDALTSAITALKREKIKAYKHAYNNESRKRRSQ